MWLCGNQLINLIDIVYYNAYYVNIKQRIIIATMGLCVKYQDIYLK